MKKNLILLIFLTVTYSAFSQTNYALSFNGTSDYVTIGTPLATNNSYTKEAWVYVTTLTGARNIISSLNAPLWINAGILSAGQSGNYALVTDVAPFVINTWTHVAVTYDVATTTMNLYKNGILVSSNNAVPAYSSENTFIGSHQGSSSYIQGNIDEVRLWNTALTQQQLKQIIIKGAADNAAGLIAYYKCNDGSGVALTNTAGASGTLQNTTAWSASPVQFSADAVSFDGTNDVVNIADDNTLDITSAITLEAWCYATKNSGIQNVISKSNNTINTGYIFPRTDNGWNDVVLYLFIAGGWRTVSAPYASLNAWHHLAATYDGAAMKLYIDGVLSASVPQTGTIATNNNLLTLGNQTGYLENFGGAADEFRIWNVARTQAQIQATMNTELNPATQAGLVSYYTVNQGIINGNNNGLTTLIDGKGNNNGTFTNFSLNGSSSNFVSQYLSLAVLPVSLINFSAEKKENEVILKWATASEQNSEKFTIQYSKNGIAWENIGTIPAAGNSNTVKDYTFIHSTPINGMNYYRLVQADIDGRKSYSDIKIIKFTSGVSSFIVINNPVTSGLLQVKISQLSNMALYNNEGKMIWQQKVNAGTTNIDVSGYSKGVYLLKSNTHVEKIIVQ